MTLTEFLHARFDEDEERARFVQREQEGRAWPDPEPWRLSWHDEYDLLCIEPSRALAEVDAKRQQIEQVLNYEALGDGECGCCHEGEQIGAGLCPMINPDEIPALRLLALPYAGHPDYDESWRS